MARKLDVETVVEAAFAVLDKDGLDGLTVRSIAKKLGVQNPALYWHFRSKAEIVDAMALAMLDEAGSAARRPKRWDAFLEESARSFRRTLLAHRDGARVMASANLSDPAATRRVEDALVCLVEAGFEERAALIGIVAVFDYTLGATFEQQADPIRDRRPARGAQIGFAATLARIAKKGRFGEDTMFEGGLRLLIDGLRASLH
jgi:TetR/AcrR family tetracycline transcriptional repressor